MWSPLRMIRFAANRIIVDPIRDGRLLDNGWPSGLKPIVGLGLGLYAVMIAVAVFAARVREWLGVAAPIGSRTNTFPMDLMPVLLVGMAFAVSCLFTAALHMVWWVRIAVIVVTMSIILTTTAWMDGWAPPRLLAVGLTIVLACFALMRWFRTFHWGEFVVSFLVIGHAMIAPGLLAAPDLLPTQREALLWQAFSSAFIVLLPLALPVTLLAGAAMAELTASTVAWTVTTVAKGLRLNQHHRFPLAGLLLVVCFALAVAELVYGWLTAPNRFEPMALVAGAGYAVVPIVLCIAMAWRADRIPSGDRPVRPDPDDVPEKWAHSAPILALALAAFTIGLSWLSTISVSFGLPAVELPETGVSARIIGGVTCLLILVWAWRSASQGRRVTPMGMASFAGFLAMDQAMTYFEVDWSYAGMLMLVVGAAAGITLWLLASGRLTTERGLALGTVVLLAAAFDHREIIFEPLTALLGLFGAGSAILIGLLWRLLTDNNFSRGDSLRFPRSGRVLVAVASVCFAALAIGLDAVMGGGWAGDIEMFESAGDRYLGVSLIVVVWFAGLSLAARGRVVTGHEHHIADVSESNPYPQSLDPAAAVRLSSDD